MATLLNIETSTSVCSVALTHEGQVIFRREIMKDLLMLHVWADMYRKLSIWQNITVLS